MRSLLQDLRFGLRSFWKAPAFSLVASLVLAIGIGANTAVFSLVDALLLRPLPYRASERLVGVHASDQQGRSALSPRDIRALRERAQSFETLVGMANRACNLAGGGPAQRVFARVTSPEYFQVFDGTPLVGRTFAPSEGAPGRDRVAVLSYGLFARLGSDPGIVGKSVT